MPTAHRRPDYRLYSTSSATSELATMCQHVESAPSIMHPFGGASAVLTDEHQWRVPIFAFFDVICHLYSVPKINQHIRWCICPVASLTVLPTPVAVPRFADSIATARASMASPWWLVIERHQLMSNCAMRSERHPLCTASCRETVTWQVARGNRWSINGQLTCRRHYCTCDVAVNCTLCPQNITLFRQVLFSPRRYA